MASDLRLSLTFEPLEEVWPHHPADLLLDVQALYFAARTASNGEDRLLPYYREELRHLRAGGLHSVEDLVAESEYLERAARRLQAQGADPEVWEALLASARFRARQVVDGVVYPQDYLPEARRRRIAPRLRRMSMGSPFDLVLGIPAEYWTGGGLLLFLTAVERKFNVVERIRTERAEEAAKQAEARARQREAEVREALAQRQLAHLRQETPMVERQVEGLGDAATSFQLQSGELVVEGDTTAERVSLEP